MVFPPNYMRISMVYFGIFSNDMRNVMNLGGRKMKIVHTNKRKMEIEFFRKMDFF